MLKSSRCTTWGCISSRILEEAQTCCKAAVEGRRLKVSLAISGTNCSQGLVSFSVRQDEIARREASAGGWVLVKEQRRPERNGDEKWWREREKLGKHRTSSMANWGRSFTKSLGKAGERPSWSRCTLPQAALVKCPSERSSPVFFLLKKNPQTLKLWCSVQFQANRVISELPMVQCVLGLHLLPPCKSWQTPLRLTDSAQAKWDKLIELKQRGRGRSEKQTCSAPWSAASTQNRPGSTYTEKLTIVGIKFGHVS